MQKRKLSNKGERVIKVGIFFNILLFIAAAILLITGDFFGHTPWMFVYYLLSIPVIFYWLYLLRWWYINDRNINHFLGLFFLMGFYSIYYGSKVIREKNQ
jgi:carbon starvation protein CstA